MTETVTLTALAFDGDKGVFAKAFVAAQKAQEAIKKANTNDHFKSKYADLAGVVEAVVPALNANGIGYMQSPAFDGELIGVTTILIHESGASCTATLHMRPSKSDPQGVGSAITYARRYALLAMTGAAPEDDDGNAASGPRQEPRLTNVAKTAADIKPPTLKERADRLEATLKSIEKAPDLDKAFALASALLADLDAKDPERLADLDALYKRRQNELAEKVAA